MTHACSCVAAPRSESRCRNYVAGFHSNSYLCENSTGCPGLRSSSRYSRGARAARDAHVESIPAIALAVLSRHIVCFAAGANPWLRHRDQVAAAPVFVDVEVDGGVLVLTERAVDEDLRLALATFQL